jgi:hypothetical protein
MNNLEAFFFFLSETRNRNVHERERKVGAELGNERWL